jgi:3-oxoacyl-[acyl-carrier protein] reductase
VRFEGAIAIVTGASRGVGRETALRLAAEGAVVLAMARDRAALEDVAREARSAGTTGAVHAVPLDVRDRASVREAVASRASDPGTVDILVANAGVERVRPLVETSDEDVDVTLDTNLAALIELTRAVLPGMLAHGRGHIVAVASMAGLRGFADDAVYCATKFGVIGFMEALDEEVRARGVKVTTICPGAIDTDLLRWLAPDDPARRHLLRPPDVAEAILWALAQPPHVVVDRVVLRPFSEPPYGPMIDARTMQRIMGPWETPWTGRR